jgi:hypothetical protein
MIINYCHVFLDVILVKLETPQHDAEVPNKYK